MRMLLEIVSNVVSASGRSAYSGFKGLETSEDQVAVKRTGISSDTAGSKEHFFVEFLVLKDQSTHDDVGVTSHVLGQAVVGDISTKEKRRAEER